MEIVSPSGRIYAWNKPTPPTEADIAELQKYDAAQDGATAPATTKDEGGFMGRLGQAMADMGDVNTGQPNMRTPAEGEAFRGGLREGLANGVRYGAPIAALPFVGPGLAGAALIGAAGATGEAGAQAIENQGAVPDAGQVVKSGIVNAIPAARFGGTGALAAMGRMATTGAMQGGAEVAGQSLKRGINEGNFQPYDSMGEARSAVALPIAVGGGMQLVNEAAGALARGATTRAERLKVFKEAGVEKPTLDMIFPGQVNLATRAAAADPKIAQLKVDAQKPILEQFQALATGAPEHEAVYAQLRPFVGKLDGMQKEVAQLQTRAQELRQIAQTVEPAAMAEATVAELNAVNARAALLHEAQANLGSFLNYDATAQQFTGVVDDLFKTRKQIGALKFDASGVPADAPIFGKDALLSSARRSLSRWKGTDMEKRILDTIQQAGGDDAAALNLEQFRELRAAFTDRFAGLDPRQLGAYEAAGRAAYSGLTEQSRKIIAATPGANPEAYDAAVRYWRETAEAASSRYAKPLLNPEPSENTFQSLAADLVAGKSAEVRAFNEFVDTVAQDAPQVAQLAKQRLTGAIRNSFLGQARTAAGLDAKKLTDSLLRAQSAGTVDVAALGFGSPGDIRRWADTLKEFKLTNLAEADFNRIFSDPQVQTALGAGKPLADAIRPAAARVAFKARVEQQLLYSAAGKSGEATTKLAEARRIADAAGITAKERAAILAEVQSDPVARAFSGQDWGIGNVPGANQNGGFNSQCGITTRMMNLGPKDGLTLVRALDQRNPVLAEDVRRRVLADMIQPFFRPANTPGNIYAIDKAEIRRFFHPLPGSPEATHAKTLEAMVGAPKFQNMERMMKAVALMSDVEKSGGILSTDGAKAIYTASSLGRAANVPGTAFVPGLLSLRSMVDQGRYHTLAALAAPGKFQDMFWKMGGDMGATFNALPFGQQLLLMRDPRLREEINAARAASSRQ